MTEVEGARAERKLGEQLEKVKALLRPTQLSTEFAAALAADVSCLSQGVWGGV
jgi:hypothetical protein